MNKNDRIQEAGIVVYTTRDYDLFNRIPGNRFVTTNSYRRLLESVKRNPDLLPYIPIVVDEEYRICDGQNRARVSEKLGLPVYFIKKDKLTIQDTQALNSGKSNWRPFDWANSFIDNENYKHYVYYKTKHHLNHELLLKYLGLEAVVNTEAFRDGKFRVPNIEKSRVLIQQLLDVQEIFTRATTRNFAFAFFYIAINPDYNHKRMIRQLQKYALKNLTDRATPLSYAWSLQDVYNIEVTNPVQLVDINDFGKKKK